VVLGQLVLERVVLEQVVLQQVVLQQVVDLRGALPQVSPLALLRPK